VAEQGSTSRRLAKALVGSLLVYALPLVGPQAVWLVGEYVFADVSRMSGHKPFAWIALDFAVALAAQGALALLLAWVLAHAGWRASPFWSRARRLSGSRWSGRICGRCPPTF
jgi:hypothetical protein